MFTHNLKGTEDLEELLRVLSMYGPMPQDQFLQLFPDNTSAVENMITRLRKSLRIAITPDRYLSLAPADEPPNPDVLRAVWVLISFGDKVVYHTISDFPTTLTFFSESEVYEVVVVHPGQEPMMNHAFWCLNDAVPPRRIVVLDDPAQVQNIHIYNTAAYCTVAVDGKVSFFKEVGND